MIQGTDIWLADRCGKITSSRLWDLMDKTRAGKPTAKRKNYIAEKTLERITGVPVEHYRSTAMRWGTEQEADARTVFEMETGRAVREVGFIDHPTLPMCGASPDGLIGEDTIIEIKCPLSATHIAFVRSGVIDPQYYAQMQWVMECTGRTQAWFVSYDPRCGPGLEVEHKLFKRDEGFLASAREEVVTAEEEIMEQVEALQEIARKRATGGHA